MDELTRNFLISKIHGLKNLAEADIGFLETMVRKTSEDIMELQGVMSPLLSRQLATSLEDFNPLESVAKLGAAISHVEVVITMLRCRKDVLGCCLKGMRVGSSELSSVMDALREVPVVPGEDDAGSQA